MSNILVVGGGPSGIMSAITAAKNGNEVILIERNGELGRKLRVTGGGRCNFTNYREIRLWIWQHYQIFYWKSFMP